MEGPVKSVTLRARKVASPHCPALAGLLVEFHQHAAGLHVMDPSAGRPDSVLLAFVEVARAAPSEPPTACVHAEARRLLIVVVVRSGKHHAVDNIIWVSRAHKGVAGVPAVPGHRQPVIINLITDGERRIFSRRPVAISTQNLFAYTR